MPSTTEIRFKKHGAADAGGRKKRNHNNRGPMEHFPGLMTKAEVDNWFEEAKKMPLNTFFSEPADTAESAAPKAEPVIPLGMRGSMHNSANNGKASPPNAVAESPKADERAITDEAASKPISKTTTTASLKAEASPKAQSPIAGKGFGQHETNNGIITAAPVVGQKNGTIKPSRAVLLAEESLAAAEAIRWAAQKMLQASEDAVKAAKAQLLLAQTQAQ
ncbi:hypothetical protein SMACR_00323 [Sordaria macrospora]|uniref:WGS project CABT00000000 data, contig 2.1 n=2 Tax=Sordaria macrospora TaxID=5147 RepID=F7VKS8_SORMK|nr:uncharacterized protein SMAC_00323 [Sordaria macrospora k-hell]KAA8636894.1 hypothetical protein SMACR_00323 [Sordaria macrospora]WPJ59066.1 hypothetical protein SMAC4_00323 [Sordaria macrospora]CCC06105.1 unnamed protein product [Sordaria macrospora k-hell]